MDNHRTCGKSFPITLRYADLVRSVLKCENWSILFNYSAGGFRGGGTFPLFFTESQPMAECEHRFSSISLF